MVDPRAATRRSLPRCICRARSLSHSCCGRGDNWRARACGAAYRHLTLVALSGTGAHVKVAVKSADVIFTLPMLRDNPHLLRTCCLNL